MEPKDAICRSTCSSVNMFPALSRQSLMGAPTVNSSQMARHGPSPTIVLLLNDESAHPALSTTTCHPSNIDASLLEMVESP